MSYHSFADLEVWRRARSLVREVSMAPEGFRDRALRGQMRRAAVSMVSKIAEGAERNASTEFSHVFGIAQGSAAGLRTQLYLTMDSGLVSEVAALRRVEETKHPGARLGGLRQSWGCSRAWA